MQNNNSKLKIILVGIIFLAAFLRIWDLGDNPPHLTSDEAALGYNAYSILKTGRDEHGKFLPIVFESFGDWKPGLYVYLTVPFVAVLGLTEWAVRLPGALSGVLAIWLVYLVMSELFSSSGPADAKAMAGKPAPGFPPASARVAWRRTARVSGSLPPVSPALFIPVVAAFFLAISPWHLQFSRGAWEAGVSLTFVLLGVYLFLKAIKGKPSYLLFSSISFGLTLWIYQGAKFSTFVVVLGLLMAFKEKLFSLPKAILLKSFLTGLLVSAPILLSMVHGKGGRLEVYSVFSYPRSPEYIEDVLRQGGESKSSLEYIFYHSEPLSFARGIVGRWFNYYSGRFLFFEGDWQNKRHSVPNSGVLIVLDSVFLVAGFVVLSRISGRGVFFLWWWLAFAPLPAVLSRDWIHGVRSLNMVVPLTLVVGLGASSLWIKVRNFGRIRLFLVGVFVFAYLVNYFYYLDQYWVHAPRENSKEWQFGYKELVQKVSKLQDSYSEVVIQQGYDQPYIFFLFYNKYDPGRYQKLAKEVFVPNEYGDVGLVKKLDNITFKYINWPDDRGLQGRLFAADTFRIPVDDSLEATQFRVIDEIKYLDGTVAFRFVEIL